MKWNLEDGRRLARTWAIPLLAIAGMLLLAQFSEVARFFLFAHHLFWILGFILLINPVSETFWPVPGKRKAKRRWARPTPASRSRSTSRRLMAKQSPTAERQAERLIALKKQKEAVEKKIERLAEAHTKRER